MHTRVFVKIVELSSYYHPTQSTLSFMLPYGPSMLLYYIQFNLFILRNTIRDCSDITGSRVRLLQKRTLVSHDFPNYYQTDYNCMHYLKYQ